jgi:hypothetical protein
MRRAGAFRVFCTGIVLLASALLAPTALASSAPSISFASPSPTDGSTVTTGSAQFVFTYNRTPKQTKSLVCVLQGPSSSSGACDNATASTSGSSSGVSYGGLADGFYTLTVWLTLTDGGSVSATRHFSVAAKSQAQLDCESFGGTYSTDPASNPLAPPAGTSFAWGCNGWDPIYVFDLRLAETLIATDCDGSPGYSGYAVSIYGVGQWMTCFAPSP